MYAFQFHHNFIIFKILKYLECHFFLFQDCPQKCKTKTVKDTNNPIFQEHFMFEINRKSRSQLRQFKRAVLKLEVFCKG